MSDERSGVPPLSPPVPPVHDSARRLQIGVAGMLIVLLLVGMAGVIGDRARENAAQGTDTTPVAIQPGDQPKGGSAPLEELGVQPVSKDENEAADLKVPQAPPAATVPDLEPDPALERARQSKQ